MTEGVRLFFTIGSIAVLIAFLMGVERGDRGSADSRFWRDGQGDLVRRLIMRPDGTLRRYAKLLVAAGLAAFIAVIWLLP